MVYVFVPVIHNVPIYFPQENKTLELNLHVSFGATEQRLELRLSVERHI